MIQISLNPVTICAAVSSGKKSPASRSARPLPENGTLLYETQIKTSRKIGVDRKAFSPAMENRPVRLPGQLGGKRDYATGV